MKIRSQVGMVLNLDKCIGCHTCSVTCKNVWTGREGMEYAWFNNVETKPGIGYPKNWEDQDEWQGGWVRDVNGKIRPRLGSKMGVITKIFANPVVPQIDDYYEPFTFDYEHLHSAPEGKHIPTARPRSLIDGKRMDKVIWGPNWEELLGGEFEKRARDRNFEAMQKEMYGQFENTFMMYLPRLCEHCLNPSCVATCPSGAIYKREEDGIVLIDQDKCRGWRLCISGCPYKKIYFNWKSGKSEKCIFCYPRIESGQPTVCSETCVGRIRYLGVLLYDADRIEEAASTEREVDLYERQCEVFLDPHDPSVIEEALKQGIPQNVIDAAQRSPVYKMAMDWKLALPLHPEYRTLPMVWYVPPLSPIQSYADAGGLPKSEGVLPAIESLRIPVQYLANMLSAGDTGPVLRALKRMMAMRHYMRSQTVEGVTDTRAIDEVGLSVARSKRCIAASPLPTMKTVLSFQPVIGKWRAMPLLNATAAVLPLATVAMARTANSTCSTVAVSMPSTSPKCATKRRANNADPQSDRPVDGVSGRAVVGMQGGRAGVDPPRRTDSYGFYPQPA